MENKRSIGKKTEQEAANYLKLLGYKIVEKNYTIRGGEIDIIAREGKTIVFVEVKSLHHERMLALEQTVSSLKKQRLIKTCQYWLLDHEMSASTDWRIDFVGIVIDNTFTVKRLKHIKNAIY